MVRLYECVWCVCVNWPCVYLTRIKFYSPGASEVFPLRCLCPSTFLFYAESETASLSYTWQALGSVKRLLTWVDRVCFQVWRGSSGRGKWECLRQTFLWVTPLQAHHCTPENRKHLPCSISSPYVHVAPSGLSRCWGFWHLKLLRDTVSSWASLGHCVSSHKPLHPL